MDVLEQLEKCDPIFLKDLTGKYVSISTLDNDVHNGAVYVIDPISKTIVLTQIKDNKKILKIVMFHALKTFKLTPDAEVVRDTFIEEPLFERDIEERRIRLKNWFIKNLIDVTEDGKLLRIRDDFSIGPPYTISQCVSNNAIILERMIQLIERMP
ncbi:gem-associated protein 6-like [Onthophagus taurus]|uniref:gem-associated protein 6-like n=1 Tax=Onthophagus taurus TaxID=166361 RepID=UPI0039BE6770